MVTSTSPASSAPQPMRERVSDYLTQLQETIVTKLETYGSDQKFRRESWTRDEGGGGLSCTLDAGGKDVRSLPFRPCSLAQITPLKRPASTSRR